MAIEVKWIKLAVDLFNNKKIRQIEKMPDGDSIIVIWVKLLCLAGQVNDDGQIYFTHEIPYTEEMLATEFNRPLNTVRMALQIFQRFRMIEVIDDIYRISSWAEWQNVDGLEKLKDQTRKRVAAYRERKRLETGPRVCQYCGGDATGVDHIIPIARGGKDTDDNKVPCCIECNRIKNDKPLVDFLNRNRDRINDAIVAANPKLQRYVTLRNVTDRYEVTQSNDIDKDIDIDIDIDIEVDKEIDKEKGVNKDKGILCSEPDPPPAELYADVEPVILNTGQEWRPTVEEYERYTRLYPAVDIAQAFRNMNGWCHANKSKRKTARGVERFVNTWLSSDQDKATRRGYTVPAQQNQGGKPDAFQQAWDEMHKEAQT